MMGGRMMKDGRTWQNDGGRMMKDGRMWQNDGGQNDEQTIRNNGVDGVSWQLVSQGLRSNKLPEMIDRT
jgi:hypothetical protein